MPFLDNFLMGCGLVILLESHTILLAYLRSRGYRSPSGVPLVLGLLTVIASLASSDSSAEGLAGFAFPAGASLGLTLWLGLSVGCEGLGLDFGRGRPAASGDTALKRRLKCKK